MNLAQLKQAAESATPGPWEVVSDSMEGFAEFWNQWHTVWPFTTLFGAEPDKDSSYIALCDPQTILKLVAIAEAAKEVFEKDGAENQYFALKRLYDSLEGIE